MQSILKVNHIAKRYGKMTALDDVSFEIKKEGCTASRERFRSGLYKNIRDCFLTIRRRNGMCVSESGVHVIFPKRKNRNP